MTEQERLIQTLKDLRFTGTYTVRGGNVVGYTSRPPHRFWAVVLDLHTDYNFTLSQVRYNKPVGKGKKHKCSFALA